MNLEAYMCIILPFRPNNITLFGRKGRMMPEGFNISFIDATLLYLIVYIAIFVSHINLLSCMNRLQVC